MNAPYYYPIFTEIGIGRQILVKLPSIKFPDNSFSVSRASTHEQTDG